MSWWVGPKSDLEVMNELLLLGEYGDLPVKAPARILDLGSHIGVSILAFRTAYPDAQIVGIEPDPDSYERLRRNVGSLSGVEIHRRAVAATDGTLDLNLSAQPWMSGAVAGGSVRGTVQVEARSLDRLLDDLGWRTVDLVKIDVEGAEVGVLRASGRLADVGAIVGELHDWGGGGATELSRC